MGKKRPTEIETVRTPWLDVVFVCRKCGNSGFGEKGRDSLRQALKVRLREAGMRQQIGVIEVDCLSVCPKKAVTVGLASRPERLLVVPEGERAEDVLARLRAKPGVVPQEPVGGSRPE